MRDKASEISLIRYLEKVGKRNPGRLAFQERVARLSSFERISGLGPVNLPLMA